MIVIIMSVLLLGLSIVCFWPFFNAYSREAHLENEYCTSKDYANLDVHPVEACIIRLRIERDELRQELFKTLEDVNVKNQVE